MYNAIYRFATVNHKDDILDSFISDGMTITYYYVS